MQTVIPLPLQRVPDSRTIEIPPVNIAAGVSLGLVATLPLPFNINLVDLVIAGRDTIDNATGAYHVQAMIRNLNARWVKASLVLTISTNPGNTNTVTIGTKVYTFLTSLTTADGAVKIGADIEASINNLYAAINLGAGAGTTYGSLTTAHPSAVASAKNATTLTATAITAGTAGNLIATAETVADGAWAGGASFLAGGVDAAALISTTDTVSIEEDSGWIATVTVDGANSTALVKVTSDGTNITQFGGFAQVIKVL